MLNLIRLISYVLQWNFDLRLGYRLFNAEMNPYSREMVGKAYTCCRSEGQGLWTASSRAGRVRRHAIEWVWGRGRGGGGHAREPKHIERIHHSPHFTKSTRVQKCVRHCTPAGPILTPPFPAAPLYLSALSCLDVVSRRAASSPFAPLSRALSPYQIESLYFASSIISFINLRAFRTL